MEREIVPLEKLSEYIVQMTLYSSTFMPEKWLGELTLCHKEVVGGILGVCGKDPLA